MTTTVIADIDLESIARVASENEWDLVVLHGSRARGDASTRSDFDLAIMPCLQLEGRMRGAALAAAERLARELGRSDLDIVWLPEASWLLQQEVAKQGVALFEAHAEAFSCFQANAHWRAIDADHWRGHQRSFLLRFLAEDWSMNRDLVQRRLESVARYIKELEPVLETPKDLFVSQPRDYHSAERLIELLVENAARINTEVAASVAKLPASDYYSSFFSLSSAGWLDSETATGLAPLASLRNVLVHQYEDVRLPDLYDVLRASLPHWHAYVKSVATQLLRD